MIWFMIITYRLGVRIHQMHSFLLLDEFDWAIPNTPYRMNPIWKANWNQWAILQHQPTILRNCYRWLGLPRRLNAIEYCRLFHPFWILHKLLLCYTYIDLYLMELFIWWCWLFLGSNSFMQMEACPSMCSYSSDWICWISVPLHWVVLQLHPEPIQMCFRIWEYDHSTLYPSIVRQ